MLRPERVRSSQAYGQLGRMLINSRALVLQVVGSISFFLSFRHIKISVLENAIQALI